MYARVCSRRAILTRPFLDAMGYLLKDHHLEELAIRSAKWLAAQAGPQCVHCVASFAQLFVVTSCFFRLQSGFHMTVVWSPRIQHTYRAQFEKDHLKGECIFEFKVHVFV